jgi:quercetin dioxygenase-like cupin family protein
VSDVTEPQVVRKQQANIALEGGELVRKYFRTGKLVFSVATVLPGQRGMLDPGHEGADEVAYVAQGRLIFEFPNLKKWLELEAGDAVLIPEGEPHAVVNAGEEMAIVTWSVAPNLGRASLTQ